MLLQAHIAFLELIIDPACSTVFEADPPEKNIMKRPPRDLKVPLLNKNVIMLSIMQGLSILTVVFAVFMYYLYLGRSEDMARTLSFTTLVFANLMLIMTNLSWTQNIIRIIKQKNNALWIVEGSILAGFFAVLYLPFLRNLFHFSMLYPWDLLICFTGGVISLLWFEGLKFVGGREAAIT
jgi:Ca2+-transporting ATPase